MRAHFSGKRWIVMAAFALGLFTNTLTSQTKTTVTRHRNEETDPVARVAEAETAIEKHDYQVSEALLRKVVEADPRNYQAWFDLGFVCNALGRPDESIAAYRKSVEANPKVFESNLNLGLSLARTQNSEAERFLRDATSLTPMAQINEGKARAWLSLARVIEAKNPADALEAYRQAEIFRPYDPQLHCFRGALLEKQNHFDEAAQEYKTALALDRSSKQALIGLANVSMRTRGYAEAEEALRKLAVKDPVSGAIALQLGRVLYAEGKKDDAIVELEKALKFTPDDPEAERDLADMYMEASKFEPAFELYRKLMKQFPDDAEVHDAMGKTLLNQHKFAEAQQEFLKAVRLKPNFGSAYGDLAAAANETKNYALVIEAADARAKYMPEIPISFFLRATAYDHLHDIKAATLNYHRFLDASKNQFPDQEWQARQRLIVLEKSR
jgi:Flp pilus assembly protein TadD